MAKTRLKTRNAKTKQAARGSISAASDIRLKGLICLLLILLTLVAYWQVFGCDFITSYDDNQYVTANPFITKGLGLGSLSWAFTTFRTGNWHPLTWISYMADYQMFELDPGGYHLTNLLFHIANALILFLVLSRMTGAVWKSGFVASLFAVHPLHVESVAWVAERKDLLSTFFWLITMYAYLLYAARPSMKRFVPVVIAFGLGLMCKPMLVSLPLVLLLLDYWPLDRADLRWRLVWEKTPLFVMSAFSCIMTLLAQRAGDAVVSLVDVPFAFRIGNAAISYIEYVLLMVWPSGLAAVYPHRGASLPTLETIGAILVLAAATILAIRYRSRRPYLAVGWLWYLITLVPVIGLVQVGLQSMADRYSYIPLTGLFVIVAWGIPDLLSRRTVLRRLLPALAAGLVVIFAVCTWFQVKTWRDSYSLFDHAIQVTRGNHIAYNLRGVALDDRGRPDEAIGDFSKAIEIQPDYPGAYGGLGLSLLKTGNMDEGIKQLLTAVRLGFSTSDVHLNLALAYQSRRQLDLAAKECREALRLEPASSGAHNVMAVILSAQGKRDEAISHFRAAAELDPSSPDPHGNMATTYFFMGDFASAWREVHVFESMGGQPDPRFIADLSRRMPDPGR